MNNFDMEYKQYESELDLWEKSICVSTKEPNRSEIEDILSCGIDQIRREETMRLNEYVFILSQYLIFLQRKSNECDSFIKWIKNSGAKFIGEDKTKSLKLVGKVELRQSRIAYLSRRIEFYCQAISSIARQRNMEYKNG